MQDIKDIQENDKSPLLKAKKPRPPPSEKQKENFQKMAAVRAENIKKRKEEKILEAQQALLAKNGIQVPSAKKEKLKEKQPIQFEIEEQESGTDEEEKPLAAPIKTPKVTAKKEAKETKPITKVKQPKMIPVIVESETDYSSDSSEEVIVIKRGKKKPKAKAQKKERHVEEEDDEEEYLAEPAINYTNYFC
jgi:hypothetical protein